MLNSTLLKLLNCIYNFGIGILQLLREPARSWRVKEISYLPDEINVEITKLTEMVALNLGTTIINNDVTFYL